MVNDFVRKYTSLTKRKVICFLLLGKQQYRAIYPNIHVIIHADNGYHKPNIPLKEILLALAYMHFLYVESFDYN